MVPDVWILKLQLAIQHDLAGGVRRIDGGIGGFPGQVVQPEAGEERR